MKPPFDDTRAIVELLRLYRNGAKVVDLSIYFSTTVSNIRTQLHLNNIRNTKGIKKYAPRLTGKWVVPSKFEDEPIESVTIGKAKYKYEELLDENINRGMSYAEYCEKYKVKVPRMWGGRL